MAVWQFQVCHLEDKQDVPGCGPLWRDYDPELNKACVDFYVEWLKNNKPTNNPQDYLFKINLGYEGGGATYLLDLSSMQQTRILKRWVNNTEVLVQGQTRRVQIVQRVGSKVQ